VATAPVGVVAVVVEVEVLVLVEVLVAEMVNGVVPDSVPQVKVTFWVPALAPLPTVVVPVCEVLLPDRVTVLNRAGAAAVAVEEQPVAAKATVPPGATVVGKTLKPNEVTLLLVPP